jgi:hypothetical protein
VARAPSERLQEGINRLIFLQTRLKLKLCPVIGNSRDKRKLWKKKQKEKKQLAEIWGKWRVRSLW